MLRICKQLRPSSFGVSTAKYNHRCRFFEFLRSRISTQRINVEGVKRGWQRGEGAVFLTVS